MDYPYPEAKKLKECLELAGDNHITGSLMFCLSWSDRIVILRIRACSERKDGALTSSPVTRLC